MTQQSFLDTPEKELIKIANECHDRAGSALQVPQQNIDDFIRLRLFLEAQLCLTEVIRKRGDKAATHDRDRENRHFWIEIGLTVLIVLLIGVEIALSVHYGRLGLSEGRQQAAILDQMNKNTRDTGAAIQEATTNLRTLADEQTQSLKILQRQEADRLAHAAKIPHLVLYVGNTPVAKVNGPLKPSQGAGGNVILDLVLRNVGDAPANKLILRAQVPRKDVWINPGPTWTTASDLPDSPGRTFISYVDSLRPTNYITISTAIGAPNGAPAFRVTFSAESDETRTATPLGVLTITP